VQKALESLPWVRKATVDYDKKQATLIVENGKYNAEEAFATLKLADFGAEAPERKQATDFAEFPSISFHVVGMMKAKSGAT
jgi:hypothetical protein